MRKIRVLFLCTGNSARSQMAEALLRKYGGGNFEVYSAGLEPKGINPLTKTVIEELGINMDSQYSKHLDEFMGKQHFGYVITVCAHADAGCPAIFPGTSVRLHWDIDDPAALDGTCDEKLMQFRKTRDLIKDKIKAWIELLGMKAEQ